MVRRFANVVVEKSEIDHGGGLAKFMCRRLAVKAWHILGYLAL
jgi:hypothetical protein